MKAWQSKEVEGVWRTGTVQCIPANVAVERAESVEVLVAIVDLIYQWAIPFNEDTPLWRNTLAF